MSAVRVSACHLQCAFCVSVCPLQCTVRVSDALERYAALLSSPLTVVGAQQQLP